MNQLQPGQRLRQVRDELGKTQKEIGIDLGVEWHTIRDMESGKQKVNNGIAKRLEELYSIRFAWLMFGEGDKIVNWDKVYENSDMPLDYIIREIIGYIQVLDEEGKIEVKNYVKDKAELVKFRMKAKERPAYAGKPETLTIG